ncbi:uncharacterized protein [Misgurnus anguillicaudatus]|uniref:uncharacterized protein isoform X2 n=1 Tax=Misgurnus anguillicaudatus TaxID=75329 RepID=UPI003CCF1E8F
MLPYILQQIKPMDKTGTLRMRKRRTSQGRSNSLCVRKPFFVQDQMQQRYLMLMYETYRHTLSSLSIRRLPIAVLCSRLDVFKRKASRALPPKQQRSREVEKRPETKSTPAHPPRTLSPSHHPVTFVHEDQRPLPSASDMVSFGSGDNVEMMSSSEELEDWAASDDDAHAATAAEEPTESRPHDSELIRILTKATAELDIHWSPPSEPQLSRLDEWYLQPGRRQSSRQRQPPFFPEVHQELTKAWRAPDSTRAQSAISHVLSPPTSARLQLADGGRR